LVHFWNKNAILEYGRFTLTAADTHLRPSMTQNLKIDVYVELICPWCLIGKSNLESALAQLAETDPDLRVQVQWHTVQLLPEVPQEGWPFAEFYVRRLGSPEAVRQRQAQVRAAAAKAGVEIDFARIERFPNTTLAHRLLAFAASQPSVVDAMLDRLFEAYFQRGENIGEIDTLLDIAQELGLSREAAAAWLDAEPTPLTGSPAVSGVPLFVFNEKFSLSGAQPPAMLLSAIRHSVQVGATA
jgi:predicted DsbA family dithiol-disulfide isomerase